MQAAVARQIIPQQHQYAALALDGVHLRHLPRVATADLPAHARDEHLTPLRMRALMREGYLVQRNDNGTVTYCILVAGLASRRAASESPR